MNNGKGCVITTKDCRNGLCNKFSQLLHIPRIYHTWANFQFTLHRVEKGIFSVRIQYTKIAYNIPFVAQFHACPVLLWSVLSSNHIKTWIFIETLTFSILLYFNFLRILLLLNQTPLFGLKIELKEIKFIIYKKWKPNNI